MRACQQLYVAALFGQVECLSDLTTRIDRLPESLQRIALGQSQPRQQHRVARGQRPGDAGIKMRDGLATTTQSFVGEAQSALSDRDPDIIAARVRELTRADAHGNHLRILSESAVQARELVEQHGHDIGVDQIGMRIGAVESGSQHTGGLTTREPFHGVSTSQQQPTDRFTRVDRGIREAPVRGDLLSVALGSFAVRGFQRDRDTRVQGSFAGESDCIDERLTEHRVRRVIRDDTTFDVLDDHAV